MKKYVDITSNEFWDILYNEACVEGQQAERIEKDLKAITITEAEIREKVIDEFVEALKKKRDKRYLKVNCDDLELRILAEQLKES